MKWHNCFHVGDSLVNSLQQHVFQIAKQPKKATALKIPQESTTRAVIYDLTPKASLIKHRTICNEAQT